MEERGRRKEKRERGRGERGREGEGREGEREKEERGEYLPHDPGSPGTVIVTSFIVRFNGLKRYNKRREGEGEGEGEEEELMHTIKGY